MKIWLLIALAAALFWGAYVPTIFYGQQAFGPTNPNKSMRAFLFIGLAYFVMAVLIPGLWLYTHQVPEDPGFTLKGGLLSTLAGTLGALGALGVVFSLKYGGTPLDVAPLVFAGAPIVNVLVSWVIDIVNGKGQAPTWQFGAGLALAIAGTVIVLLNSPAAHAPPKPAAKTAVTTALPTHAT